VILGQFFFTWNHLCSSFSLYFNLNRWFSHRSRFFFSLWFRCLSAVLCCSSSCGVLFEFPSCCGVHSILIERSYSILVGALCYTTRKSKISEGNQWRKKWNFSQILWSQNLVTELERDFTFSLTKYPSLIFVFLVVLLERHAYSKHFNFIILFVGILSCSFYLNVVSLFINSYFTFLSVLNDALYRFK